MKKLFININHQAILIYLIIIKQFINLKMNGFYQELKLEIKL